MKQIINQQTFDVIWDTIKDRYDISDWETCETSVLDRVERLEIKMKNAFNLIESITLSLLEENTSSNDTEEGEEKVYVYDSSSRTNWEDKVEYKVNWKPLEEMVKKYPKDLCIGDYMYMGTYKDSGIHLYKNSITRGYINIDSEGCCWKYDSDMGSYYNISHDSAINGVNR